MTALLRSALDPTISAMLDNSTIRLPPAREQTPAQLRKTLSDHIDSLWQDSALEPVSSVEDRIIEDDHPVPVRIYTPAVPRATIVYFHGGGFVAGSIDTHDRMTRRLANGAKARVVSAGYRLAPEHPFPAGPDDCLAATSWAAAQFPDTPIMVAGDSAGGTMTICVTLRARDLGHPNIAAQVLIYPAIDATLSTASMKQFAQGYGLTGPDMEFYFDAYLPELYTRTHDAYADPFRRHDLEGLPPALVTTAGFDPLLDEGAEYAARLLRCGVPVHYQPEPSLIHGYLDLVGLSPAARAARDRLVCSIDRMITDFTTPAT